MRVVLFYLTKTLTSFLILFVILFKSLHWLTSTLDNGMAFVHGLFIKLVRGLKNSRFNSVRWRDQYKMVRQPQLDSKPSLIKLKLNQVLKVVMSGVNLILIGLIALVEMMFGLKSPSTSTIMTKNAQYSQSSGKLVRPLATRAKTASTNFSSFATKPIELRHVPNPAIATHTKLDRPPVSPLSPLSPTRIHSSPPVDSRQLPPSPSSDQSTTLPLSSASSSSLLKQAKLIELRQRIALNKVRQYESKFGNDKDEIRRSNLNFWTSPRQTRFNRNALESYGHNGGTNSNSRSVASSASSPLDGQYPGYYYGHSLD
ncbi:hypothetical protein OIO90_004291 [Microbotryomycetes sp. JL221]|nr:hypothetical protein OIO90_004291 [Microbotryomycetes sp. JL221]